ncbi:MAG TPA: chemotaxis protein CheW [Planctomycetia bacterium]|jgi:purine-binding chemotaxis protein CheW|nr:chemotaxis protein CheW [Planctomycetia bacterium]
MTEDSAIDEELRAAVSRTFGPDAVDLLQSRIAKPSWPSSGPLDDLMAKLASEFGRAPADAPFGSRSPRRRDSSTHVKAVVARLKGLRCAFRMDSVVEVMTPPSVAPVPNVPNWILGVTNLRGEIVSVVDFRAYVGFDATPFDQEKRVIVLRSRRDDMTTGLAVDGVEGIRHLPFGAPTPATIELPPKLAETVIGLAPLTDGYALLLDAELLLAAPELRAFEND